jgi:hypothetical protein
MPRLALVAVVVAALSAGCATVGLTLIGAGLGVGAGTVTGYTMEGIAYRTFAAPIDDTRGATLLTLRRMDMKLEKDVTNAATDTKPEMRDIVALAGDRTIYIELEKLTSRTTRMRVTAKQGWFFRDRATAGEIVAQTADTLGNTPSLSEKSR